MVRCESCAAIYPDPRPNEASLADYYPEGEYYAYSEAARHRLFEREGLTARLWYGVARGVLAERHGYRHLGGSRLAAKTIGRVPALHRRATHRLDVLMHPWRPGGSLLEVGCGSGRYLDLMRALGWSRVVGVDVSPSAVARAKEALGLEAYAGDLRSIGFPDATFDGVSLSHTLEHVVEPVALLAEVRRVTKPGGRIAIVVPNISSLTFKLTREHCLTLDAPRHLVNFSPEAFRAVVERAGLKLESLRTPIQGSYGVALFSRSRAHGDPHSVYTDDSHRFAVTRRVEAGALAAAEGVLCVLGFGVGAQICAVARA